MRPPFTRERRKAIGEAIFLSSLGKGFLPPDMVEAMMVVETGMTPQQLAELPEELIARIRLYRDVTQTIRHGGSWSA